jgi:hypothetical protein
MLKSKIHFEVIPLEIAKKILAEQQQREREEKDVSEKKKAGK